MDAEIALELPYPPSVNTYWRRVGVRTIISRKGRKYREAVNAVIRMSNLSIELSEKLSIEVSVYPPDARRRDLDNICKSVFDSLCDAKVYKDDSQLKRIKLEMFDPYRPDGMIFVKIQEYKHDD